MEAPIEKAIERAIAVMHDNIGEAVTIDDMARAAMFSKFHFARTFQRTTGVSPRRFLSAVRLQRAKQLLVTTSLNVADISVQVGYNSVGTFSSRFTRNVGLSPTSFRRLGGYTLRIPSGPAAPAHPAGGLVWGRIRLPARRSGLIYTGLFSSRMPAGRPIRCRVLNQPGAFQLNHVPDGTWYLLSHFVSTTNLRHAASRLFAGDDGLAVGSHGPIVMRGGSTHHADLALRPMTLLDPPVLLALLDVRRGALAAGAARQAA